jgi:RimJ/RimL family protein N-acetyltransferase
VRFEHRDIDTSHLGLRAPRLDDAASVFAAFGQDSEVTRFLTWRPHRVLQDAERAMQERVRRLADGSEHSWCIVASEGRGLIGLISAWPDGTEVEVGFVLARPHWGRGLMTEALLGVTEWVLATPGVTRLWATTDAENVASARVLEKAGYRARGPCQRDIIRPNMSPEPRPSLLFERPII